MDMQLNRAESKNFKSGIYYLADNYTGAPYYQKQKIFFKKNAGDLVLDCNSYLNNPSVRMNLMEFFMEYVLKGKKYILSR